jgi:AbiJ N-terminal domain 3
MKHELRPLIADALHQVKSYSLPSVCERYGMETGEEQEAFRSKRQYVLRRLERLSDEKVFLIAKQVLDTYPDDNLQAAVEQADESCRLISDLTRQHLVEVLDRFPLSERRPVLQLLVKHWPGIQTMPSYRNPLEHSFADDIERHLVRHDDWSNSDVLEQVGLLTCSQAKLFGFLEDILHPIHRSEEKQAKLVSALNPILQRDGYTVARPGAVSGYPVFRVIGTGLVDSRPAVS